MRSAIVEATERRVRAESDRAEAMRTVTDAVRAAYGVLTIADMMALSGLTRRTIHRLLGDLRHTDS